MSVLAAPQRVVDLRPLPPQGRRLGLLSAFDALSAGESFVLVSAQDPRPYLEELQASRKGLFDWSPVEEDPGTWHVEIARRAAEPGTYRRVTEALAWDHDRLDALEGRAFAALAAGDVGGARNLYRTFQHGLNRHIRFEEELLFPVFEAGTGLSHSGPTEVMRAEHREIRMRLEELGRNLDGGETLVEELRAALHRVLGDHNRKEEAILYPATDRILSDIEGDTLVSQIQAFPA